MSVPARLQFKFYALLSITGVQRDVQTGLCCPIGRPPLIIMDVSGWMLCAVELWNISGIRKLYEEGSRTGDREDLLLTRDALTLTGPTMEYIIFFSTPSKSTFCLIPNVQRAWRGIYMYNPITGKVDVTCTGSGVNVNAKTKSPRGGLKLH
ncbi:hypothetical protein BJ165DRAFT_1402299 [Panaeolus papilionaceus]|nr:hypothetical protein BJ165DRAFT_1402299 [Panaeolus papilionaceus]